MWGKRLLLVVLAVALGVFAFRLLWPRPTIADDAEQLAWASFHGDSDWIADHLWEGELQLLGWDRDHATRFLKSVVFPKFRLAKEIRVVGKGKIEHGTRGLATFEVISKSGERLQLSNFMTLSDGGTVNTVGHLLQQAWMVELLCSKNAPKVESGFARLAVKTGIVRDYELLQRWRFKGFMHKLSENKLNPLDTAYESAKTYLAKRASGDSASR